MESGTPFANASNEVTRLIVQLKREIAKPALAMPTTKALPLVQLLPGMMNGKPSELVEED